jgi:hypothetical protein
MSKLINQCAPPARNDGRGGIMSFSPPIGRLGWACSTPWATSVDALPERHADQTSDVNRSFTFANGSGQAVEHHLEAQLEERVQVDVEIRQRGHLGQHREPPGRHDLVERRLLRPHPLVATDPGVVDSRFAAVPITRPDIAMTTWSRVGSSRPRPSSARIARSLPRTARIVAADATTQPGVSHPRTRFAINLTALIAALIAATIAAVLLLPTTAAWIPWFTGAR